mmetsp:Transcript_18345/g.55247  ORF Transcript_18345/g.55247 Transcript_18345/m.55247 type:complete len:267 (-) Transcript_18345:26-826(-)
MNEHDALPTTIPCRHKTKASRDKQKIAGVVKPPRRRLEHVYVMTVSRRPSRVEGWWRLRPEGHGLGLGPLGPRCAHHPGRDQGPGRPCDLGHYHCACLPGHTKSTAPDDAALGLWPVVLAGDPEKTAGVMKGAGRQQYHWAHQMGVPMLVLQLLQRKSYSRQAWRYGRLPEDLRAGARCAAGDAAAQEGPAHHLQRSQIATWQTWALVAATRRTQTESEHSAAVAGAVGARGVQVVLGVRAGHRELHRIVVELRHYRSEQEAAQRE